MKTIFIGIAAYNEPYIEMMIDNCLKNAEYPERIRFGIWCHNSDGKRPDLEKYNNTRYAFINHQTLLGTGVARLNSLMFYDNEDYYLQLDAHTLFQKHWDSKLLKSYQMLKNKYDKVIISTYTRWWSKSGDQINYYSDTDNHNSGSLSLDYEKSIRDGYPKPKNISTNWNEHEYIEHHMISGHFLFTENSFIKEIMPDPLLVFGGEEITTAVRAWTRGYRIFTIKDPIAWHLNKLDGDRYENDRHWDKNNIGYEYDRYKKRELEGRIRTRDILLGNITGYWGATSHESLKEYEKASGINFQEIYSKIIL